MKTTSTMFGLLLLSTLSFGCRTPLMTPVANVVDDINDTHVYFDNWYDPRFDISRAGKPDWCSPINSRLAPGICYLGSWNRYDDENLYPPSNPYSLPSHTMPPPKVRQRKFPPPQLTPADQMPPQPTADAP